MKIPRVLIIDAGLGNIGSIEAAFMRQNCLYESLNHPPSEEIEKHFTHVVLPGVGAFKAGMKALKKEGWVEWITQKWRGLDIPLLGICLGMQLAMIEFARNCADIKNATSMEFDKSGDFVVHYMEGQSEDMAKGGSMRLGAYECHLEKGSLAQKVYGTELISERHRHRLEVNNQYVEKLENAGMKV